MVVGLGLAEHGEEDLYEVISWQALPAAHQNYPLAPGAACSLVAHRGPEPAGGSDGSASQRALQNRRETPVEFQEVMESVGKAVDVAGVVAIVLGIAVSSVIAAVALLQRGPEQTDIYHRYRRWLGRSILLGLELLVAADIIRTVAVAPTFQSVGVLALIVLIRTFLSFSLELEITGRWPWQKRRQES